jgi:hypothetical protein
MGFFQNRSGVKWNVVFMWHGLYGAIYTPKFGWSYNFHPNRIRQIYLCHFRKETTQNINDVTVCVHCGKIGGH